jgi:putative GTP pyrophosphokinase
VIAAQAPTRSNPLQSAADWRATGAHYDDPMAAAAPSRKQIRNAAKALRHFWMAPPDAEITSDIIEAWRTITDYRATFQRPLDKVTIQLRRFVGYEVEDVIVAQRLKRMPTILDKLERQPTMDITRMQDIGGCRAVLPERGHIEAVLERIGRHWPIVKVYDYMVDPKPSGYRAVHVAVSRDDRLIEIQLRTPDQQKWAEGVERAGARLRLPVKDGVGPAEVLEWFRLLGQLIALVEAGEDVDDALVDRIDELGPQVRRHMGRNG